MVTHAHSCKRCDSTWNCSDVECTDGYEIKRHGCWQQQVFNRRLRKALEDKTGEENFPPPSFLPYKRTFTVIHTDTAILTSKTKHSDECLCVVCKASFRGYRSARGRIANGIEQKD